MVLIKEKLDFFAVMDLGSVPGDPPGNPRVSPCCSHHKHADSSLFSIGPKKKNFSRPWREKFGTDLTSFGHVAIKKEKKEKKNKSTTVRSSIFF